MSTTGNIALAETHADFVNGDLLWITNYTLRQPAPNGHQTGQVTAQASQSTESVFNLTVQQAVADRANLESADGDGMTASDVYGGRI
jgi:hypothetical protein